MLTKNQKLAIVRLESWAENLETKIRNYPDDYKEMKDLPMMRNEALNFRELMRLIETSDN